MLVAVVKRASRLQRCAILLGSITTLSCATGKIADAGGFGSDTARPKTGAAAGTGVPAADGGRAEAAAAGRAGTIDAGAAGSAGSSGRGAAGRTGAAGAGAQSGTVEGAPRATYYVKDGQLFDACGEQVVLRGVNHPTLYVDRKGAAMPEIAKTGANAVRLFWAASMGVAIGEAEPAIKAAIQNGMLPILEMHDSTCAWNLDGIVSYWTSTAALQLIERYQANLIVNIANETRPPNAAQFQAKYASVVQTLRQAGIHTPLMIDGGNCGRDYGMLFSQGEALLAADPEHNLIFSAHLYDPLSAAALTQVFDTAVQKKLPFVVGEFSNKQPPGCGSALDYATLIAEAEKHGTGWLAWSWGDNDPNTRWNSDCGEFDMTATFAYDSLERWGKEVAVTLPASIENTSHRPASLVNGRCK
jgi:mannan endo-1,4-beta-mannosidase